MAVNCLVIEPRRNFVSGAFGILHSKSARPNPFLKITFPFSATSTAPLKAPTSWWRCSSDSMAAALSSASPVPAESSRTPSAAPSPLTPKRIPTSLTS